MQCSRHGDPQERSNRDFIKRLTDFVERKCLDFFDYIKHKRRNAIRVFLLRGMLHPTVVAPPTLNLCTATWHCNLCRCTTKAWNALHGHCSLRWQHIDRLHFVQVRMCLITWDQLCAKIPQMFDTWSWSCFYFNGFTFMKNVKLHNQSKLNFTHTLLSICGDIKFKVCGKCSPPHRNMYTASFHMSNLWAEFSHFVTLTLDFAARCIKHQTKITRSVKTQMSV